MSISEAPSKPTPAPHGEREPRRLGDLGRRVLLGMFLVALVPAFVVAYQGYHCARQAILESAEDHLLSVLASRKHFLDVWLHDRLAELGLLASLHSVECRCAARDGSDSESSADPICHCVDALRAQNAAYERVVIYDSRWQAVAATPATAVKDSSGALPAPSLRAALEAPGGLRAGEAHVLADGSIGVRIGHVVKSKDGTVLGAVIAELNMSRSLSPLLEDRSGLGRSGTIYLVGDDLTILTGSPAAAGSKALRRKAPPAVRSMAERSKPEVLEYVSVGGRRVLGAAVRVPLVRWTLVAEKDVDETLAWLGVLRLRAAVTAAVAMAGVLVLAFWISRRISAPLRELAHVAGRIRGGHLEERVGPLEGREADALRRTFNAMLDELDSYRVRLLQTATLASVGELSSSVVHEIRNPLSSIKMNLQALREAVAGDSTYEELAAIAFDQVQRVEGMLNDLLSYGRPVTLSPEPVTFEELAKAALDVTGDLLREKNVDVSVEDRLGDLEFPADRELMCRALSNLLRNAIQAVESGGHVVFTGREDPAVGGRVLIEVADDGPGLSEMVQAELFKPFFSTREGGTGLGLANVKKIVELHGGRVSADPRAGGGARFTVSLPRETAASWQASS